MQCFSYNVLRCFSPVSVNSHHQFTMRQPAYLANPSLTEGIFTTKFKSMSVTLLLKGHSPDTSNHRPISNQRHSNAYFGLVLLTNCLLPGLFHCEEHYSHSLQLLLDRIFSTSDKVIPTFLVHLKGLNLCLISLTVDGHNPHRLCQLHLIRSPLKHIAGF